MSNWLAAPRLGVLFMPLHEDRSYYEILGIGKDATDTEIKKAYRKLAAKYHPDKAGNDPVALAKFKEMSEAYQVLSDSEKKVMYDRYGTTRRQVPMNQGQPTNMDFSNFVFRSYTQGGPASFSFGPGMSPFDMFFGPGAQFTSTPTYNYARRAPAGGRPRAARGSAVMDAGFSWRPILLMGSIVLVLFLSMLLAHPDESQSFSLKPTVGMSEVRYVAVQLPGSVQTVPYYVKPGFRFKSERHERRVQDAVRVQYKQDLVESCRDVTAKYRYLNQQLQRFEATLKRQKPGSSNYKKTQRRQENLLSALHSLDMKPCELAGHASGWR
ncbi:DnaJ domain [Carpediemonas membranifera]|uniref:DnaJ domain n=1 Tax=Carpediemonas membranifera TaxID=201153 RepID=A0A8J6B6E0_9EUKA|nr:DnaJ domain [Carpediemonas membranifera]|eukprot:KAG9395224.1 DnaJ domain [Carpediemonas membranifera]